MLPNFLIIGAARSGTTSLYYYMARHPEVFMSATKEPNFFAFQGETVAFSGPGDERINRASVTERNAYEGLFEQAGDASAVGEASVLYLYAQEAAERIKSLIPDTKLIAILRNPVERAYSSYLFTRRENREPLSEFGAAIEAEEARILEGWQPIWHYTRMGFYGEQLTRYYERFSPEQIKVLYYEEWLEDPSRVYRDIASFLGVDAEFEPDFRVRLNPSGVPRSRRFHELVIRNEPLKAVIRRFLPRDLRHRIGLLLMRSNLTHPRMNRTTRDELRDLYRNDILKLQTLTERDLSHWLSDDIVGTT